MASRQTPSASRRRNLATKPRSRSSSGWESGGPSRPPEGALSSQPRSSASAASAARLPGSEPRSRRSRTSASRKARRSEAGMGSKTGVSTQASSTGRASRSRKGTYHAVGAPCWGSSPKRSAPAMSSKRRTEPTVSKTRWILSFVPWLSTWWWRVLSRSQALPKAMWTLWSFWSWGCPFGPLQELTSTSSSVYTGMWMRKRRPQ
mmetsp:Transcript_53846/g.158496  ORF Transcript_53846/g.158496 Transcript_53846/m.158496 type:complete len:204 (-) Transcript_53846:1443-2054(-)